MNKLLVSAFAIASLLTLAACSNNTAPVLSADNSTGIIGGQPVTPNSELHSSIVGIYDAEVGGICTGSLLPNNIVLTAAHCVGPNPSKMFVIFYANMNELFESNDQNQIKQYIRIVQKAVVHEGWNFGNKNKASQKQSEQSQDTWNDIALLKFKGTIPAGFKPATLLSDISALKANASVTLAGYGVDKMQVTEVNPKDYPNLDESVKKGEIICSADRSVCAKIESSGSGLLRTTKVNISSVTSNEVILDQTHGTGACNGDSGGPAYIEANGQLLLWGITSRGSLGCDTDAIYTNALTYLDWIKKQVTALQ